ncbi:MAG: phytoene desaturase family protein [Anaerolineales bacterium]
MTSYYDAIIIGGGHNGLVTAAYLAKAGRKVLVLERRPMLGGAAITEEFFPGFKFSACADGGGQLLPQVIRGLELKRHGLEMILSEIAVFAPQPSPQPNGAALTLWHDPARTARELEKFSKRDAARYPDFVALVGKLSAVLGALMTTILPQLPQPSGGDVLELAGLLGPLRKLNKVETHDLIRILPMSMADWLDEWFESEALRGVLAARAVTGLTFGPRAAGTAYTFLYSHVNGSRGMVQGGMGALSQALANAARAHGAETRVNAEVSGIMIKQGRATGVVLANGEEISAPIVISNADPRTTYLKLLDPSTLDSFVLQSVRNIKYRGSGARVHLALNGLPHFAGADPQTHLRGHLVIAPSLDYVERAYDDAKYGEISRQPYLDVLIPSLSDPSLAPAGQHTLSVYVQYAPYKLNGGWNEEQRKALGDRVIERLSEFAPNLQSLITHCRVLTPCDLEKIYGLPEGNPSHGEMTLDQFLHMRPVPGYAQYRAPVEGVYLCGAGTHPGGGVTGANGYNAARVVLKDLKK